MSVIGQKKQEATPELTPLVKTLKASQSLGAKLRMSLL